MISEVKFLRISDVVLGKSVINGERLSRIKSYPGRKLSAYFTLALIGLKPYSRRNTTNWNAPWKTVQLVNTGSKSHAH